MASLPVAVALVVAEAAAVGREEAAAHAGSAAAVVALGARNGPPFVSKSGAEASGVASGVLHEEVLLSP